MSTQLITIPSMLFKAPKAEKSVSEPRTRKEKVPVANRRLLGDLSVRPLSNSFKFISEDFVKLFAGTQILAFTVGETLVVVPAQENTMSYAVSKEGSFTNMKLPKTEGEETASTLIDVLGSMFNVQDEQVAKYKTLGNSVTVTDENGLPVVDSIETSLYRFSLKFLNEVEVQVSEDEVITGYAFGFLEALPNAPASVITKPRGKVKQEVVSEEESE